MLKAPRGMIEIALILYIVAAVAAVATIGIVAWKAQHWCNVACQDARAETKRATQERDALAAEKKEALRREAAIAVKYGEQVNETQRAQAQRDEARNAQFRMVAERARALPAADAGARIPASVVGVLDAATRAANAAGTPAGTAEAAAPAAAPADSSGGLIAGWFAVVAEIHAECRDRVAAWESFYRGLRAASEVPLEQVH